MVGRPDCARESVFNWRDRRAADPTSLAVYALIGVQGAFLSAILLGGSFVVDSRLLWDCFGESGLVILFAWAVRWLRFERIATLIEIVALLIIVGTLTSINSLVLASLNLPLADPLLASIDRALFGFDRRALAAWLAEQPDFMRVSNWIYHSTALSTLVLFAGLLWRRGTWAAWRVLATFQIASILCLCVFALVPAFGTPPYAYRFEEVLIGVRDGSLRTIMHASLTGVVTFPSMHAAGGLLLAWGLARVGRLAAPFVALNLMMIASAVTSGGHYMIDVIAGLAIAALGIHLSRGVETGGASLSPARLAVRGQRVSSAA